MKKTLIRCLVVSLNGFAVVAALPSCAILKTQSLSSEDNTTSSKGTSSSNDSVSFSSFSASVSSSATSSTTSSSSSTSSSSKDPNDHNSELISSSQTESTVSVTTKTVKNQYNVSTKYFIADINLKRMTDLRTHLQTNGSGQPGLNITATPTSQISEVKSETGETVLAAINGDMPYFSGKDGYVIRNGGVVRSSSRVGSDAANDDYAIYYDGTTEPYQESDITASEIAARGCYQSWEFGPTLLEDGSLMVDEDTVITSQSSGSNERTAIGFISPLHYVFFMSQGRLVNNDGFSLFEEATILKDFGCVSAYNLDGGGSSYLYANGNKMNTSSSSERAVNDIIYVVNS